VVAGCAGAGGLALGEAERGQQEPQRLQGEEDPLQQAAVGAGAEPVAAGRHKIENASAEIAMSGEDQPRHNRPLRGA